VSNEESLKQYWLGFLIYRFRSSANFPTILSQVQQLRYPYQSTTRVAPKPNLLYCFCTISVLHLY